jgi:hypothetical protein
MGYYKSVFCSLYQIFPYSDIIHHIIHHLKRSETEDSRVYHLERYMDTSIMIKTIRGSRYQYGFVGYHGYHGLLMRDLMVLSLPFFWELHLTDWEGSTVSRKWIEGYTYRVPRSPWDKPVKKHRWLKIDLYNHFQEYILDMWKIKENYPNDGLRIQFKEEYLDTEDFAEEVYVRWIPLLEY